MKIKKIGKRLIETLIDEGFLEVHEETFFRTVCGVDILQIAEDLLSTQLFVTTLEIKNALRARHFWITQEQVSKTMDHLYRLGILTYYDNGTYREYNMKTRK